MFGSTRHLELGASLRQAGDFDGAVREYGAAIELADWPAAKGAAIAHGCLGDVLLESGRAGQAVDAYARALELEPHPLTHSNLLFAMMFDGRQTAASIGARARDFGQRHVGAKLEHAALHPPGVPSKQRLRVGYVSPNFHGGHCQSLFTVPLFENHDHDAVEVFAYSSSCADDLTNARLVCAADHWREVGKLGDRDLARLIWADGVDVLVDLTMHMSGTRQLAFARKPAPVQIAWLAYPGTTGNGAIDYRVSDPHLDPGDDDEHYTERTLCLPDSFWCYDPLASLPEPSSKPAARDVVFCSLNAFAKVNLRTLEIWSRVLCAVPSSRLLMLVPPGEARARVVGVFASLGVSPDRLELVDRRPREEYLRLYERADIGLDALPYNGHTTTLDAAWMGVPTVTMPGRTVVGRAGLSINRNLGLPELVADTAERFVEVAVGLASDPARLEGLRRLLRDRVARSALGDGRRFARNLETVYRAAWLDHCARSA